MILSRAIGEILRYACYEEVWDLTFPVHKANSGSCEAFYHGQGIIRF